MERAATAGRRMAATAARRHGACAVAACAAAVKGVSLLADLSERWPLTEWDLEMGPSKRPSFVPLL